MKLLFTKRNNFGSKLIEWGTDGDCSHFAVVFDDKPGGFGLVFHSHLTGAGLDWLGTFEQKNEIVHFASPLFPVDEEAVYQSIVKRFNHKPYDKGAYLYFGWRVLLKKLLGKPLPESNRWGSKDKLLCTELAGALKESMPDSLPDFKDYGIISPSKLFQEIIKDRTKWAVHVS